MIFQQVFRITKRNFSHLYGLIGTCENSPALLVDARTNPLCSSWSDVLISYFLLREKDRDTIMALQNMFCNPSTEEDDVIY